MDQQEKKNPKKEEQEKITKWKQANVKRVAFELRKKEDKSLLDYIDVQRNQYGVATNAVIRSALQDKATADQTAREIRQDADSWSNHAFIVKASCIISNSKSNKSGSIPPWCNTGEKIPCEKISAMLDDGATLKLERDYSYIVGCNTYALMTREGLFILLMDEKSRQEQEQRQSNNRSNKDYLLN